jgi:tRNA A37 N6-isopentenylltransferase MiaA
MCPVCLASMGLIIAGATSAGGLTALAVKLARKNNAKEITPADAVRQDHRIGRGTSRERTAEAS